ncbi:MAG: polysaccharide biosynthesis protein [Rhodospirillales bacterium]
MNAGKVLITGVCGTIGKAILSTLSVNQKFKVIGLDINETALFDLDREYASMNNVEFQLCDIGDTKAVSNACESVDTVYHTAAFKHVGLCERAPMTAIRNNILGLQSVIDASVSAGVSQLIFTSSDKAVNPTNVMGTSKLMGERLMTAASTVFKEQDTKFVSVRFGNILGSSGSVVPVFEDQISKGGPVTVTNPDMTRFVMSSNDAVSLLIESASLARTGDVVVTKMPSIRVGDLATIMIDELAPRYGFSISDIEVVEIGSRPGEKFFEELINDEECRRTIELEQYFIIRPAFSDHDENLIKTYPGLVAKSVGVPYKSNTQQCLSPEKLRRYLLDGKIITGQSL